MTVNVLDKVKISMFADDCILYLCGYNWNNIHNIMQEELNRFIIWTNKKSLRLNESKTQAMIVGTRNCLLKLVNLEQFIILGKNVKFVKQYSYLGITLNPEMTLTLLYKNIEKRVLNKVYMLKNSVNI